jgi:hypothetical protein
MDMQKASAFFLIVLSMWYMVPLGAQEEDDQNSEDKQPPIESDWSGFMPSIYARGDQIIIISPGITIPIVFVGDSGVINSNLQVGGALSLSYNYFLTPRLFIGGELQGMFATTLAGNIMYMVPFGVRLGYQIVVGRFEFPFTLVVGGAPQSYLNNEINYFGFFMKGMVSGFFRFSADWSFGINVGWWWVPEWMSEPSKNVHGNFLEVTLAARYHF